MNKKNVLLCAVVSGMMTLAWADAEELSTGKPGMNPNLVKISMKRNGGFIEREGSFKGKIVIVDERARPDTAQFFACAKAFNAGQKFNVAVKSKKADGEKAAREKMRDLGAQLAVFVIEDDKASTLLIAPEEGWAQVNAKALVAGVEKSRLAPLRIQKEVLRALGFVAGGMSSQYVNSLAGPVTKPSDLDLRSDLVLPMDVISAFRANLEPFGITPYVHTTYRVACQEGWAPAPTNEYQKAIWEQVKADKERGPTNPIKIPPPKRK